MKSETFFKIRRISDGQYSNGGTGGRFSAKGKTWRTHGALKNHMNLIARYSPALYNGCEIVKYETIVKEISSSPAVNEVVASNQRKAAKEAERQAGWDARVREQELATLDELRKKYGL